MAREVQAERETTLVPTIDSKRSKPKRQKQMSWLCYRSRNAVPELHRCIAHETSVEYLPRKRDEERIGAVRDQKGGRKELAKFSVEGPYSRFSVDEPDSSEAWCN